MPYRVLSLDPDPALALTALHAQSREHAVLVFKRSPICPVSTRAEGQLEEWLASLAGKDDALSVATIDVIAERELARGLTRELGIDHESPQALWFETGKLVWHDSHGALTVGRFEEVRAGKY